MTESRSFFVWYEDSQKYIRCICPTIRDLFIEDMTACLQKTYILSNGDLYTATLTKYNSIQLEMGEYKDTYNKKDISGTYKVRINLKRIPFISRASDVFADVAGENFGILQVNSPIY